MAESNFPYDALLQLKDAGSVSSSAAAQVASADKILTVGDEAIGGDFVVDVSALDQTTGDEQAYIQLQGSNSASFASGVVTLAMVSIGGATAATGGHPLGARSAVTGLTRYSVPFKNVFGGTRYAYLRAYHALAGTSPSVNYVASLSINKA